MGHHAGGRVLRFAVHCCVTDLEPRDWWVVSLRIPRFGILQRLFQADGLGRRLLHGEPAGLSQFRFGCLGLRSHQHARWQPGYDDPVLQFGYFLSTE